MNSKGHQRLLSLILTGLVLLENQSCVSQNDSQYQTCSKPFQCGSLSGIGYPFYGGNRSISCGYPGFELDCSGDDNPRIQISSIVYRVLDVNNSKRTLKVSRNDLWPSLCPGNIFDTTLNFTLFDYYWPANDRNISLFYNCPLTPSLLTVLTTNLMFNCTGFSPNVVNFFVTGEVSVGLANYGCISHIYVPVNQNLYLELVNSVLASIARLRVSIESGFSIQWWADNQKCDNCRQSDGLCGYNQSTASFACHCSNGASAESTCHFRETGNGNENENENETEKGMFNEQVSYETVPLTIKSDAF